MIIDLHPAKCPCCGRAAAFHYISEAEARRGSPLCWGESERSCPGYVRWKAGLNDPVDVEGANIVA
jgi:hypothetical protein